MLSFTERAYLNLPKTVVMLTCFTASLWLSSCATESSKEAYISYPGLSVHGLDALPATDVFTDSSAWVYLYRNDNLPNGGFIRIRAIKSAMPDPVQQHVDYRLAQAPLDTCLIITDGDGHSNAQYQGSALSDVTVGASLIIDRPGDTPYTITNLDSPNRYRLNEITGSLPAGATLSIASDAFPSVEAYRVSDTQPPLDITPNAATWVNLETKYTWKPSGDPGSYVEILFYSRGPNTWPEGFGMRCDVIDDGEFELPTEALDVVSAYENSLKVGYFRISRRIDYQDGVLFYQKATAVGDFSGL